MAAYRLWKERTATWSNVQRLYAAHSSLCIATGVFLLGATISLFTAIDIQSALGEWKAFYIEPVLLCIILVLFFLSSSLEKVERQKTISSILLSFVYIGFATGILATIQRATGWMVPWDFWENGNSYRVTGWYGFPNGVGLFLAPLALLALYTCVSSFLRIRQHVATPVRVSFFLYTTLAIGAASFIFGMLGIVFAKSTGGLIGVCAGIFFLFLFYKKTRWPAFALATLGVLAIFFLPNEHAVRQELLAQNRSGQLRVQMWAEATEYLSDHPIVGAGLASYKTVIYPYRIDKWIEVFHHPHNLFLTIWVNTGFVGIFGFIWILVWFYRVGICFFLQKQAPLETRILVLFLLASMSSFLVTGLVDSPYIKNDLSLFFWALIAFMVILTISSQHISTQHKGIT